LSACPRSACANAGAGGAWSRDASRPQRAREPPWETPALGVGRRRVGGPCTPSARAPRPRVPAAANTLHRLGGLASCFFDYLYLGFTNATAFSPTDAMPLALWAKSAMALQALISPVILGLVVARAVNVFAWRLRGPRGRSDKGRGLTDGMSTRGRPELPSMQRRRFRPKGLLPGAPSPGEGSQSS
jgi:hypothetical protein